MLCEWSEPIGHGSDEGLSSQKGPSPCKHSPACLIFWSITPFPQILVSVHRLFFLLLYVLLGSGMGDRCQADNIVALFPPHTACAFRTSCCNPHCTTSRNFAAAGGPGHGDTLAISLVPVVMSHASDSGTGRNSEINVAFHLMPFQVFPLRGIFTSLVCRRRHQAPCSCRVLGFSIRGSSLPPQLSN